jgi:hypothetical protein
MQVLLMVLKKECHASNIYPVINYRIYGTYAFLFVIVHLNQKLHNICILLFLLFTTCNITCHSLLSWYYNTAGQYSRLAFFISMLPCYVRRVEKSESLNTICNTISGHLNYFTELSATIRLIKILIFYLQLVLQHAT